VVPGVSHVLMHVGTNNVPLKPSGKPGHLNMRGESVLICSTKVAPMYMKGILDFVSTHWTNKPTNDQVKLLVSNILPREDLIPPNKVNSHIRNINEKVKKFVEEYFKNVVDVIGHDNFAPTHLNAHGLHLNQIGKESLVNDFVIALCAANFETLF